MKTRLSLNPVLRRFIHRVSPAHGRVRELLSQLQQYGLDMGSTQAAIAEAIRSRRSFSYVRPGGTESEGLYTFMLNRFARGRRRSKRRYSTFFLDRVTPFSGVQYRRQTDLDFFCHTYLTACLSADLLGFGGFAPGALGLARQRAEIGLPIADFTFVEPMRAFIRGYHPWTLSLGGLKVLVVHPFKSSIELQFANRKSVSGVCEILPDFRLEVLRPPVTLRGSHKDGRPMSPWAESFSALRSSVLERDFDVALIGAGGYGAPLASAVAGAGRVGIHTAGATQLLFGIRGVRWDNDREMTKIIDDSWVRPELGDVTNEMRSFDGVGAYH